MKYALCVITLVCMTCTSLAASDQSHIQATPLVKIIKRDSNGTYQVVIKQGETVYRKIISPQGKVSFDAVNRPPAMPPPPRAFKLAEQKYQENIMRDSDLKMGDRGRNYHPYQPYL